jgi:Raf kinase inhibitor-like YbhB/YbcL family protein
MILRSPGFAEGELIPWRHSSPAQNELPPLEIAGVPEDARSLALVFENVDSPLGPVTHWLAWNIPPETRHIDAVNLPPGCTIGMDAFGKIGYVGPAPPEGKPRFRFVLYALDETVDLPAGATRQQLDEAISDHVLATAALTGYAERPGEDD